MKFIEPIDQAKQQKVIAEVHRYIDMASAIYECSFSSVDIVFNLRGRAAGMYRTFYEKNHEKKYKKDCEKNKNKVSGLNWFPKKQQQIRFNPWLFAKYPEDSWNNTVPHEVAHYISDCHYGLSNIKPHGVEWKQIMHNFGASPIVRGDYSLDGIPVRRIQRYDYKCRCRKVELTAHRHRNIQKGLQEYRCRDCSETLVLVS